jgi:hypothetical protein
MIARRLTPRAPRTSLPAAAPRDVAPIAAADTGELGLADLAVSPVSDCAVVAMVAPAGTAQTRIQAAVWPAGGSAFRPVENVSTADRVAARPSVAFDPATDAILLAWNVGATTGGAPAEIDTARR